jgi:L-histidine N-alpha-methyltransferase
VGDPSGRNPQYFPQLGFPDQATDLQWIPLRTRRVKEQYTAPKIVETAPYTVRRSREQMLNDVRAGLAASPKRLSPKYFYDERGSELFEEITQLPEYYLTRSERSLLEQRIEAIVKGVRPCSLVELGAGSATKTRIIIDAMRANGCAEWYVPIDVSRDFLEATATQLKADYPDVLVVPVVSDITEPFTLPTTPGPTLFAFLGSTIGNFSREESISLMSHVSRAMGSRDRLLLGADLIKAAPVLDRAYNDSQGITAEFNLNLLRRLNRELNANFPLTEFEHLAFYNPDQHRIEMHLVARKPLAVTIPEIGEIHFEAGESIRTEVSYKYDRAALDEILVASGLVMESWMPADDASFALALARTKN